jgi:hypothetical protein
MPAYYYCDNCGFTGDEDEFCSTDTDCLMCPDCCSANVYREEDRDEAA